MIFVINRMHMERNENIKSVLEGKNSIMDRGHLALPNSKILSKTNMLLV